MAADLRGVDSHGVVRLPVYAGRIRKGAVNPRPITRVVQQRGNSALFPLMPSIVEQLAEIGESLGLAFPNAADTTDLAETPA